MSKTVLIVGAGFGQVPAIQVAKNMGLYVLTVDMNANAPGMTLADESFVIDILDQNEVLNLAKKKNISGLLTLQNDHGVPTVGFVNDALGLTGVSYETALNCSYKTLCREKLAEKGCEQPSYFKAKSLQEVVKMVEKLGLPSVIKAPDSSGSRGITKVSKLEEIEFAYNEAKKYSKTDEIVVEEYIDGIEFGAQTFSVKGECELVLLHNDTLSDPPYMIPIGHSFPFKDLNETESRYAEQEIKKAVNAIGITDGPANIDLILDIKTKEIKIIEIGARVGATCLPELVYYHTGMNWVEQAIKSALGECNNLTFTDMKPVAAHIIFASKDGIFRGYDSIYDNENDDIIEFEITAKVGEKVSKLSKGTDRIGKVISKGESVLKAERNVERFIDNLVLMID